MPTSAPKPLTSVAKTPAPAGPHYHIEVLDPHTHRFAVTLTVAEPAAKQRVALPVWIPGSYLVREFSQHLLRIEAQQAGQPVGLRQIDKNTWQAASTTQAPLVLRAEFYAYDASVRTAWLDTSRGFFNPTSLCLRVLGQEDRPHTLELAENTHTQGWQVATALLPQKTRRSGFGVYRAEHYDELTSPEAVEAAINTVFQGFEINHLPELQDLFPRTISEYHSFYKTQKALPSEVMSRTLETIKQWEGQGFRVFSSILPDEVLQAA